MIENVKDSLKDMTPKLIGETWRKYPTETSNQKRTYGLFECQYCGKEWECEVRSIKTGNTISCGCQRKGINKTHGLRSNKFYGTWNGMLQRCANSSRKEFKDYGDRGIIVCEEWLDVRNFIAWCEMTHPNTEGVSLDRIDNDKGYSPENCRWADASTQNINQRMQKNNTSGFVGITWHTFSNRWMVRVNINRQRVNIGSFKTKEEAVQARDNYIIDNNLPHKLSHQFTKEK